MDLLRWTNQPIFLPFQLFDKVCLEEKLISKMWTLKRKKTTARAPFFAFNQLMRAGLPRLISTKNRPKMAFNNSSILRKFWLIRFRISKSWTLRGRRSIMSNCLKVWFRLLTNSSFYVRVQLRRKLRAQKNLLSTIHCAQLAKKLSKGNIDTTQWFKMDRELWLELSQISQIR